MKLFQFTLDNGGITCTGWQRIDCRKGTELISHWWKRRGLSDDEMGAGTGLYNPILEEKKIDYLNSLAISKIPFKKVINTKLLYTIIW